MKGIGATLAVRLGRTLNNIVYAVQGPLKVFVLLSLEAILILSFVPGYSQFFFRLMLLIPVL